MANERIIFLGTPEISAILLEGLIKNKFNIVGVVTKEDKVRARGNKIEPSPVALIADKYQIPVHKPHRLNNDYQFIIDLKPDLLLTFAYGQIIKEDILKLSYYKPLNLHASILPKYRGAAPIQYALRNGDEMTGVSMMEMVKEMDAGDVYALEYVPILSTDNYTSLSLKIASAALHLATEKLPEFFNSVLRATKQDESLVSFSPSIKKEEEHLDLNATPSQFVNQVRSLSYKPGGFLSMNDEILKVYKAEPYSDKVEAKIGTIISARKNKIILQLAKGQVNLSELQRPGKKMLDSSSFNNGNKIEGIILQ